MRGWMVGYRDEPIGQIAELYKFESVRSLALGLARVLDERLPCLPKNTVIIPVTTSRKHIRERGFDHMLKIAQELAGLRGWGVGAQMLLRRHQRAQKDAGRHKRLEQARTGFRLNDRVDSGKSYLVLDDIWTTGATVKASRGILQNAGAKSVGVVVLARSR
jgi:predicted amidophosphoribosyltransferase